MPNIEIHGLASRKAAILRKKIFMVFGDKSYSDETVVTVYPTIVVDKHGQSQPFIRLANSCDIHTQEILKMLQGFKLDIEQVKLEAFIPKKDLIIYLIKAGGALK